MATLLFSRYEKPIGYLYSSFFLQFIASSSKEMWTLQECVNALENNITIKQTEIGW
jgi:hypothetical protein